MRAYLSPRIILAIVLLLIRIPVYAADPQNFIYDDYPDYGAETIGANGFKLILGWLLIIALYTIYGFDWLFWKNSSIVYLYIPTLVGGSVFWSNLNYNSALKNFTLGLIGGLPLGFIILIILSSTIFDYFGFCDKYLGVSRKIKTENSNPEEKQNLISKIDVNSSFETLDDNIDVSLEDIQSNIESTEANYQNDKSLDSRKLIIKCPECNGRMRVPYKKLLKVKCPLCNHVFDYDGIIGDHQAVKDKANHDSKETKTSKPENNAQQRPKRIVERSQRAIHKRAEFEVNPGDTDPSNISKGSKQVVNLREYLNNNPVLLPERTREYGQKYGPRRTISEELLPSIRKIENIKYEAPSVIECEQLEVRLRGWLSSPLDVDSPGKGDFATIYFTDETTSRGETRKLYVKGNLLFESIENRWIGYLIPSSDFGYWQYRIG